MENCIRLVMLYGTECCVVKKQQIREISVATMRMLRWISEKIGKYKVLYEKNCLKLRVVPIDENMRESHWG